MKIREELIAEMAVIGCVRNPQAHTMRECFECGGKYGSSCNAYRHAEKLHNAGYRKQSDTAREFLKLLKEKESPKLLMWEYGEGYLDCIKTAEELAAQYSVEVEE